MNEKMLEVETTLAPLDLLLSWNNSCPPAIKEVMDKLMETKDFTLQQELIKAFASCMDKNNGTSETNHLPLKFLACLYVTCTPKNPMKKTLGRILRTFQDENDLLIEVFSENIKTVILYLQCHSNDSLCNNFIFALTNGLDLPYIFQALLLNMNEAYKLVVAFLQRMVEILRIEQNEDDVTMSNRKLYISNSCKFLVMLLQKYDGEDMPNEERLQLLISCYTLIIQDCIEYEIMSNCGIIIVLLFKTLPESHRDLCMFRNYPYLEFLKYGKEDSLVLEKLGIKVTTSDKMKVFKICVYLGILIFAADDIVNDLLMTNDEAILIILFNEVIEYTKWSTSKPSLATAVSKALNIISSHLNSLPIDNILPLLLQGLKFIAMYIHDKTEIVRVNTKNIFQNFIKLAIKLQKLDKPEVLQTIFKWIQNLPECVIRYSCITVFCSVSGCRFVLDNIPDLPSRLLNDVILPGLTHNVCSCYETLMQMSINELPRNDWLTIWINPLIKTLKVAPPASAQFYIQLFIAAFKIDPITLEALTQCHWFDSDNETCTFLGCILYIRKVGIETPVKLLDRVEGGENTWRNLLDCATLEVLYTHQNDQIRTLILGIIANNQRSTEIFTPWELQFLLKYFYYNINASKASTRQQIIAYAKKIIMRTQESFLVLQKNLHSTVVETETTIEDYKNFWISFFHKILLYGIHQGCNYARRSACLELLNFIRLNTFGDNFSFIDCWRDSDVDNLKNILLYDTYEHNKDLATDILGVFLPKQLKFETAEQTSEYIDYCFTLASSIKPAETVSGGYMFKIATLSPHVTNVVANILCKYKCTLETDDSTYLLMKLFLLELQQRYCIGKTNLQEAAKTKPLHGFLFCMRHLLKHENLSIKSNKESWRILIREIVDLCALINKLIATIICNKSPEGYLPEDIEYHSETDGTTKAQMVTVYGWRAAKEISLLFGEIASNTEFLNEHHPEGLIDGQCLKQIGDCFLYLLINTKHRGAFEQASIGFSYLCSKLWRLPDTKVNLLPKICLQNILNLIIDESDGDAIIQACDGEDIIQACETRRSAGIPFLIQAILTTEPNITGNRLFHWFMNIMLKVAGDLERPNEQQIHSMNILRALYRHNQLGELVLPYCAQGIMIAIEGFSSTKWSIRNSATLLFSALVVRIFGVQRSKDLEVLDIKNKMMAQVFFARYPGLYQFFLEQLKKGTKTHCVSMFPVLLVLSRLYCSTEVGSFSQIEEYLPYIRSCLRDSAYKTRELAARTLVNFTQPDDVHKCIAMSFIQLSNANISNSYCHGTLLQLQFLLQQTQYKLQFLNISKILENTSWILLKCGKETSHITATLYLEVFLFLLMQFDSNFANTLLFQKLEYILQSQPKPNEVSTATKKYKIYMFHLQLCLMFHKFKVDKGISYTKGLIKDGLEALAVQYLLYLTFNTKRDFMHYTINEYYYTEHSDLIEKFLKPLDDDCKEFLFCWLLNELSEQSFDINNINNLVQYCSSKYVLNNLHNKNIVEELMSSFSSTDDQSTYVSLVFLNNILGKIEDHDIKELDLSNMASSLLKLSIPTADISSRFGVSELLVHNKRLLFDPTLVSSDSICLLWIILFLLLEDDDITVRNNISKICGTNLERNKDTPPFVPKIKINICEHAREYLLQRMVETTHYQTSVNILFSIILRQTEVTGKNISEVFDEGALNTYAELFPQIDLALTKLEEVIRIQCSDGISLDYTKMIKLLYSTLICENIPLISNDIQSILCNLFDSTVSSHTNGINSEACYNTIWSDPPPELFYLDLLEQIRLNAFMNKLFSPADK